MKILGYSALLSVLQLEVLLNVSHRDNTLPDISECCIGELRDQIQYSIIVLSKFFQQIPLDHSLNKTLWWLPSNFGLKYTADEVSRAGSGL